MVASSEKTLGSCNIEPSARRRINPHRIFGFSQAIVHCNPGDFPTETNSQSKWSDRNGPSRQFEFIRMEVKRLDSRALRHDLTQAIPGVTIDGVIPFGLLSIQTGVLRSKGHMTGVRLRLPFSWIGSDWSVRGATGCGS